MAPIKHVFHAQLKIKGHSGDDAVLCTANKTFSIRSVTLSNTVLVVTPPPDAASMDFADDAVVIRDQLTEILELTPVVPKLHTLTALLKGNEFDGDQDDEDRPESKLTFDDALQTIQASDMELERGMRHEPINQGELIDKWKSLVGDAFESKVDLTLLEGNYLSSANDPESLIYFPASTLPVDPARRCAELFLARPRWKGKDITPFLADIAVDSKERDKLLLKYGRATTDADGVWYTARTQYSG
ncbi:hypothetical protein H0H92_004075 [Tricholoma furcatifolium]|nr:hypothetical protein H0H92_004075 [Tricholoma furcatifolium]